MEAANRCAATAAVVATLCTGALYSPGLAWASTYGSGLYAAGAYGGTSAVPPAEALNPSPADGATSVSTSTSVSWTAGSGATSHGVYFGTDSSPDETEYKENQGGTTYDPGTLANSTTYYWRVDEANATGTTTGSVWSFTTAAASSGGGGGSGGGGSGGGGGSKPPSNAGCSLYYPGIAVPTGFGAAYTTQSSAKELLLKATCVSSGAVITVGKSSTGLYVWDTGYEWVNGSWRPFKLTGVGSWVGWISGKGAGVLKRTPAELGLKNYFVAYTCQSTSSGWKCGCRDAACTTAYWQMQGFRK